MNLIIYHYHINPGGVTRIIESQILALKKRDNDIKIRLITGHCEDSEWFKRHNVDVFIDEVFNYLSNTDDLHVKYLKIKGLLKKLCSREDILHIHNLNLGKNPLVTLAFSEMAQDGYYILNHAHDFAEDRPENMNFLKSVISKFSESDIKDILYPEKSNYHYAVLNGFDKNRLKKTGISDSRVTLLPNPVVFQESNEHKSIAEMRNEIVSALNLDTSKKIITYPVRVIRRKNIGEFILLAGLFADQANWVVTQPPKNPVELGYYNNWKTFCQDEQIAVHWEAGTKVSFEKLIRVSDFCFTTSIKEGFGMVYMEPWLLNTPVIGRNLQMVTDDLKSTGMTFPLLYNRLEVYNEKELHELNLEEQNRVIKEYLNGSSGKEKLTERNNFLNGLLDRPSEMLIRKNKEIILKEYSLDNYSRKLHEIYQKLTG